MQETEYTIESEEIFEAENNTGLVDVIDIEDEITPLSKVNAVGWPARNPELPAIGNIDAYISAILRLPYLTQEEEVSFARKLRDEEDLESAGKLVMSHMRMVVSTARKFQGYGLPHADLIQEGTIGLMKAVKRFDPELGIRLATYASPWIKSEINDYVIKNTRMVKQATTHAQRKLFFNLRKMRIEMFSRDPEGKKREWMNAAEIHEMAERLNVPVTDVVEMEKRLISSDVSMSQEYADGDSVNALENLIEMQDYESEPSLLLEVKQHNLITTEGVPEALKLLNDRERRIVEERWIKEVPDDAARPTLSDLSSEFGVSMERVRQIEARAMQKMRKTLEKYI